MKGCFSFFGSLMLMSVTVFAQFDLTIREVQVGPSSLAAGEPTTASLVYGNNGSENITQSSSVSYFISGTNSIANASWLGTNFNVPTIPANATVSGSFRFYVPVDLSPGTYYIFFVVDHGNSLSETNENNNTSAGIAINVTAYNVDLFVDNLVLTPTTINGQGVLNIAFQLGNLGTTVAHRVGVKIWVADTNIAIPNQQAVALYSFTQLSIGGASFSTNFNRNVSFNGGNFYVQVQVDHGNAYDEPNESNNLTSFQPFTIVNNSSDIQISGLSSFSISTVLGRGNSFSIHYDLENTGNTWILDNFKIGYFLSTDQNWDASDIKIGENTNPLFYFSLFGFTPSAPKYNVFSSVTVPGTLPLGEYYLIVYADYESKIQESNFSNNFLVSSRILVVEARPDLVVNTMSTTLSYESFSQSFRLNVLLNVLNVGNDDADDPEVTFYLLDNNTKVRSLLGKETVSGKILVNGQNTIGRNYFLSNTIAGGNFSVIVVIDEDDKISELSEVNNTFTTSGFNVTSVQNKFTDTKSLYTLVRKSDNRVELVASEGCAPVLFKIFNMHGLLLLEFTEQVSKGMILPLPSGVYVVNASCGINVQSDKLVIY